jgi:deoxyribose-phosphate aldolase
MPGYRIWVNIEFGHFVGDGQSLLVDTLFDLRLTEAMLDAIRDSGRPVGFKVSGGLRTVADAALYLAIADRIMGPDWVEPKTFRIGASSLHDALTQSLRERA